MARKSDKFKNYMARFLVFFNVGQKLKTILENKFFRFEVCKTNM